MSRLKDIAGWAGILLIDKEADLTSFGVVSRLRVMTGLKRIGHCGTLDPFATGLLPVCLGRATAAVPFLEIVDKTYELRVELGRKSETMDSTGEIIAQSPCRDLWDDYRRGCLGEQVNALVQRQFVGELTQLPPMYSAVKVQGQPLYRYARSGQTVERKKRRIVIHSADLLRIGDEDGRLFLDFRIRCSKGTYMRTWANDLGDAMGCPALASRLRRLACGSMRLNQQAVTVSELFERFNQLGRDQAKMRDYLSAQYLLSLGQVFSELPVYDCNFKEAESVLCGRDFSLDTAKISEACLNRELYRMMFDGQLLALATFQHDAEGALRPEYKRVFADQASLRQAQDATRATRGEQR